jgi:hypothetical protein
MPQSLVESAQTNRTTERDSRLDNGQNIRDDGQRQAISFNGARRGIALLVLGCGATTSNYPNQLISRQRTRRITFTATSRRVVGTGEIFGEGAMIRLDHIDTIQISDAETTIKCLASNVVISQIQYESAVTESWGCPLTDASRGKARRG